MRNPIRRYGLWGTALTLAIALALVAAGVGESDSSPGGTPPTALGAAEGELDLLAGPGYVESGQNDPGADWVTSFERRTGCDVTVRVANSSDEMAALMGTDRYDGVLAPGDAVPRLIAAGDVAPLNTALIPHQRDVVPALRPLPLASADGRSYGIAQGRGANLLMWRRDRLGPTPPTSWDVVFDTATVTPDSGQVTAPDSPLTIADAALYLRAHRPSLRIDDVFELDDRQFGAAVDLLDRQRRAVGRYWSDPTQLESAFALGRAVVGASSQGVADALSGYGLRVSATLPVEGATGWVSVWMVSSRAHHLGCMYRWIDHALSPEVNAEIARYVGEAPASERACAEPAMERHCVVYHAADEAFFGRVRYATTPRRDCGDRRGRKCADLDDWTRAWAQLRRAHRLDGVR
jgi:putative spermidine/putrescine transport system substrate-binding protein